MKCSFIGGKGDEVTFIYLLINDRVMKYLFSNILGSFVFDNQFHLVEERRGEKGLESLKKKYKDGREVPEKKKEKALGFFREKKYLKGKK